MKIFNQEKIFPLLKFSISSPEQIINWCIRKISKDKQYFINNITESKTFISGTNEPVFKGLFCEYCFGPLNFNTKIINSIDPKIRRHRMGFIMLNSPIIHIWYIKGHMQLLPILLTNTINNLEYLIYYETFFSTNQINSKELASNNYNKILTKFNLKNLFALVYPIHFIKNMLSKINLIEEICKIKQLLCYETVTTKKKVLKRKLRYLHLFYINKIKLNWLCLEVLPVIPPSLRPFNKLDNGLIINSSLNELYRKVLLRNNRIKIWMLKRNQLPMVFELLEKRMLQISVDNLLDLDLSKYSLTNTKSFLSGTLKGKEGRFRQNLLGKRIDFSGRTVIVSGPDLPYSKLGLPYKLALFLYKPLILMILKHSKKIKTLFNSELIFNYKEKILKLILKYLLINKTLLINRAPSLHRMNIQAFKTYLIEGFSLRLLPIACSGFNADFDGDQMSIFAPLTTYSLIESKNKLLFDKNLFYPGINKVLFKISQNANLGIYNLLTLTTKNLKGEFCYSSSNEDIYQIFKHHLISANAIVWIKTPIYKVPLNSKSKTFVLTTIGRILTLQQLKF